MKMKNVLNVLFSLARPFGMITIFFRLDVVDVSFPSEFNYSELKEDLKQQILGGRDSGCKLVVPQKYTKIKFADRKTKNKEFVVQGEKSSTF